MTEAKTWAGENYAESVRHQWNQSFFQLNRFHSRTPLGRLTIQYVRREHSFFEIGYGGGGFYRWLSRRIGPHYLGIDESREAIQRGSGGTADPTRFMVGDYMSMIVERRYDVVFADNVFHHFNDPWAAIDRAVHQANSYVLLGLKGVWRQDDLRLSQRTLDGAAVPYWLLSIPKMIAYAADRVHGIRMYLRPLRPDPSRSAFPAEVQNRTFLMDILLFCDPRQTPERIRIEPYTIPLWRKLL